jgi:potassium-dependent mechanosensitive channel
MRIRHAKHLLFCLCLIICLPFAAAQLPDISSVLKGGSTPENTEDPQVKLSQWMKEAKAAFTKLSEPNIESQLPTGIDVITLESYRRDLEQILLGVSRYQKISSAAPEVRKTLDAARATDAAWLGFPEKPPYSILLTDELANQQDDIQKQAESYRSSLTVFERELNGLQEAAKQAEQISEQLLSEAEKNPNDGGASKWRLDADRAKSRVLATRAFSLTSNVAVLNDQLETSQVRLGLLTRQLKIASSISIFSEEDFAKIKKSSEERKELLKKEITLLAKRQKDTTSVRNKLQSSVEEVLKITPETGALEATPETILLNTKLEAADVKAESQQFISEKLESLVQLESYIPEIYQNRKTLLESNDKKIRATALAFLQANNDRLEAWQIVISNELSAVNSDSSKQESRAAAIPPDDPRNPAIADLRNALSDKQVILRRVSQVAAYQSRILKRWLASFDQFTKPPTLPEKAMRLVNSGWKFVKQIWTFPIYEYDKEIMLGGVKSTVPRFIGLGEILKGFAFFGIAYFLANRLKDRLRNFIVGHKYIAESQARTLTNWLMIGVGFLLAIATLNYLALPLTVFAFLGGALLIGVGFGTQTLIKNFISGIIVLFERKIRVGDIVDIGSGPGKIIEINTRSSILRSGDGKETLVPNSLFLENKVTSLTLSNRKIRQSIKITSTLASTPQQVSEVLKDCAERHGRVLKEPAPSVTLDDFSDKANSFTVFYWIEANDKTNIYVVASDIRFMIERRFSEMKIKATPETAAAVQVAVIPENPEA